MCLIAWNWQPESSTPLLLLANRDEFYARAALALHWWQDADVLAGRDLQAGGTWLGVSRSGRLAALTNYRLPVNDPTPKPSRGGLVAGFLQGTVDAAEYLSALAPQADDYSPFNLLLFDGQRLMGLESRNKRVVFLPPGIGGVSNADFDTPWPKLERLKAGLHQHSLAGRGSVPHLLPLLQDTDLATDTELPHTGVPLDLERKLSATWIQSENYGTRASSIVALGIRQIAFFEQGYGAEGMLASTQQIFTRHYDLPRA
jgi:uncharacterized protein with NRDE domain